MRYYSNGLLCANGQESAYALPDHGPVVTLVVFLVDEPVLAKDLLLDNLVVNFDLVDLELAMTKRLDELGSL